MAFDPSKLTPAPFRVCGEETQAALHRLMPDEYPADAVTIERVPQSRREAAETFFHTVLVGRVGREDAEFFALARNAFDVQMRRGWGPSKSPAEGEGWRVGTNDGEYFCSTSALSSCLRPDHWPDPLTALVEADRLLAELERNPAGGRPADPP